VASQSVTHSWAEVCGEGGGQQGGKPLIVPPACTADKPSEEEIRLLQLLLEKVRLCLGESVEQGIQKL
jgi:hypothetical protein